MEHRNTSVKANNVYPTQCWMSRNFPLNVLDLTEEMLPRDSECAICTCRRDAGEDTACFYIRTRNKISLVVDEEDEGGEEELCTKEEEAEEGEEEEAEDIYGSN
ncbi:hypothetical protein WAI453_011634 [Rhynchosporium graminicola]